MFVPWYMATALIAVGLIILTVITLAPLSKRKALEAVAQSSTGGPDVPADVARYDGLDSASEPDEVDSASEADEAEEQAPTTKAAQ